MNAQVGGVSFGAQGFNAASVQPNTSPDPMPSGWYNAKIVETKATPTSKNDGSQYLEVNMEVIDGPHAGRKIWDRLNLWNPNPTAVEIAYRTLSAICHATQVMNLQNTQQLHNIPLKVKIKLVGAEKDKNDPNKTYDPKNEVKGYDHINSAHDVVTTGGSTAAPGIGAGTQPAWVGAAAGAAAPAPGGFPAPGGAPGGFPVPGGAAPAPAGMPQPGAQPWPQPTAAAPAPMAPAPVAPAPVQQPPQKVMTPLAQGATYEQFIAQGWTDDQMVQQGYMQIVQPAAPAPVAAAPSFPAPPVAGAPGGSPAPGAAAAPGMPPAATAQAAGAPPPWART